MVKALFPFLLGGVAMVAPSVTTAQQSGSSPPRIELPRFVMGLNGAYAQPRGQFRDHIKDGWGGNLYGVAYTSPGSPLGIRMDAQWIVYGEQERNYRFSGAFGGYTLRETTSNNIFSLTAGPQFAINGGPFRPYATVQAGVSYFSTSSYFSARDVTIGFNPYVPSGDTYSSDWKLTYGAGAGFSIPITHGTTEVMLDFGTAYHVNGRTTYLTKGDVQRDPNTGVVTVTPRRSEAHYITYRVGVTVSFASLGAMD